MSSSLNVLSAWSVVVTVSLIATSSLFASAQLKTWSCYANGANKQVVPSEVAGVWYEIARMPSSEVPACLKVIAPESVTNDEYTVQLEYVNNVNKGWEPTKETLVFPWSEAANGNFSLQYSNEAARITVTFKYLGSMAGYTLVCGYLEEMQQVSIIRVLSREQYVNNTVKEAVDFIANKAGVSLDQLTWVQQDGKCNSATRLTTLGFVALIALYLIRAII